jgi:putative endonuclease
MRFDGGRSARQRIGDTAEQAACAMLEREGLRVVARQVAYRVGELDLVARDGPTLVFVEVRSRARSGLAAASVDAAKRQRLRRAAQRYLQHHFGDRWPPCRFDVVIAEANRLEWLRAAFGAEEES